MLFFFKWSYSSRHLVAVNGSIRLSLSICATHTRSLLQESVAAKALNALVGCSGLVLRCDLPK